MTPPTPLRGKLFSQNGSSTQLLYPTIRKHSLSAITKLIKVLVYVAAEPRFGCLSPRTDAEVDLEEIAIDLLGLMYPAFVAVINRDAPLYCVKAFW